MELLLNVLLPGVIISVATVVGVCVIRYNLRKPIGTVDPATIELIIKGYRAGGMGVTMADITSSELFGEDERFWPVEVRQAKNS